MSQRNSFVAFVAGLLALAFAAAPAAAQQKLDFILNWVLV